MMLFHAGKPPKRPEIGETATDLYGFWFHAGKPPKRPEIAILQFTDFKEQIWQF